MWPSVEIDGLSGTVFVAKGRSLCEATGGPALLNEWWFTANLVTPHSIDKGESHWKQSDLDKDFVRDDTSQTKALEPVVGFG